MEGRSETPVRECPTTNDEDVVSGDYYCANLKKGNETEDAGSNNSATASVSSASSSSSLTSSSENDALERSKGNELFDEPKENTWWIHGNGYDLREFVEDHPGGVEAILLGKGRDCTALVESYHAFSGERVWKVLEKYRTSAGEEETDEHAATQKGTKQRPSRQPDFFYELLKKRAISALRSKGIDPIKDRGASYLRTSYYLVVYVLWLYTGYLHCSANLRGSFAFAVTGWLMGALGHDAGHFAASRWPIVNEYGVWAMSFICNPVMWQQQHTYGHHSFTNEFDRDPDLHHFDLLLRVHKKFKYEAKFQYQSSFLYVLFAYLFVVFGTCFWIPIGVLREGTLYGIVDWHDKKRPTKFYGMVLHLVTYVGIVAIVPMLTHESFAKAALATYIHVATLGITFALFSQINHLNEPSLESDLDSRQQQRERLQGKTISKRDSRLAHSWAAAQVETSNNFASRSAFWHVLSNGLNHQIEHHLFPGLNHCHLHHVSSVVKQTCEEFGVDYKCYDTWNDLMNATLEWFDKLSVTGVDEVVGGIIPSEPKMKSI